MSLDLSNTATQIDGMASDLQRRQGDREVRLQRALRAIQDFSVDGYNAARERDGETPAWAAPGVLEPPGSSYANPTSPVDFCVAAVDGSHIDVDRHMPARCFLINTGAAVLSYGSRPDARLTSRPRLYARDDELTIRDPITYRQQAIEGAVLSAKRTVEEIKALVEVVRELPGSMPTLVLLDGSLVMLGLVGPLNQDFVLRELVEDGYVRALEGLREMASERPLALAAYVSLPRNVDVVNALRVVVCPYGVSDGGYRCGLTGPGSEPCEGCVGGVLDREIFATLLEPGQRSAMFATSSPAVEQYYAGSDVDFFYVNVGEEIGRVEVPSWVADDERLLGLAHALIVDQCARGRGYPVALMEAHEQAVVSGSDRSSFMALVEEALYGQRVPVYSSEKARSKRLRWL